MSRGRVRYKKAHFKDHHISLAMNIIKEIVHLSNTHPIICIIRGRSNNNDHLALFIATLICTSRVMRGTMVEIVHACGMN
jgi:hypothetical protein